VDAPNTVQFAAWAYENIFTSGAEFMRKQGMKILDNKQTKYSIFAYTSSDSNYVYYCGRVKNGYYYLGNGTKPSKVIQNLNPLYSSSVAGLSGQV
jgi:hypothetical protein